MSARQKTYLLLTALALLSVGAYFASARLAEDDSGAPAGSGNGSPAESVPVSTEEAVKGPISHWLGSTANLRAQREVSVTAQAAGIVTEIRAEEGDFVTAGDVLCTIDDRSLQIDLELAKQRLAQTKIQIESAQIRSLQTSTRLENKGEELARNEDAFDLGLLAESEVAVQRHEIDDLKHELEAVQSSVRENHARQEELEAEIRKVQLQISQASVTAPFSGRITERVVELGQAIRNTDPLFKLGSVSPLYADVFLPEQASQQAARGQPALVRLGSGSTKPAEGVVERVSPVVDDETGTVKVTVRVPAVGPAYRPGAFVRVDIKTDTRDGAVLIPKQSVIEEDGQTYVVLVGKDARAERSAVELGYQDETLIEVTSGVEPGATVVTAGQGRLKDGDMTRVASN